MSSLAEWFRNMTSGRQSSAESAGPKGGRRNQLFISVADMWERKTTYRAPGPLAILESSASGYQYRPFNDSLDEYLFIETHIPDENIEPNGTVAPPAKAPTVSVLWSAAGQGRCFWEVSDLNILGDGALAAPGGFPSRPCLDDSPGDDTRLSIVKTRVLATRGDVEGKLVKMSIRRNADHRLDTLDGDAHLIGVILRWDSV